MDKCCANCKFYEEISHRGQRYPKGKCQKHYAYRIADEYRSNLTITTPYEYICSLFEEQERPIHALVAGEVFLIPPVIANELIARGWVFFKSTNTVTKEEGD